MAIYAVRKRVACYVTRTAEYGAELLVFDHAYDDPADPSGTQIPAGGMLPYEALVAAALRETEEETGLVDLTFVSQVGAVELGLDDPGGPSVTNFVHFEATSDGAAAAWEHRVTGEGEDGGMVFLCRWEPLPLGFELAGDQGRFLPTLS
ncbi:MAG: NUDIX domain-containing protein [Nocardioidaceae bacterium]